MIKISQLTDGKVSAKTKFDSEEMAETFIRNYAKRMKARKPVMVRASVRGKAKRITYKLEDGTKFALLVENVI